MSEVWGAHAARVLAMAASPSRTFQFHCKDFLLRSFQLGALAEHLRVAAAEPALSLSNGSAAIRSGALRPPKNSIEWMPPLQAGESRKPAIER